MRLTRSLRSVGQVGEPSSTHIALAGLRIEADWVFTVGLSVLAALVFLKYDINRQLIPPDTTFHIYAGQQMLRGHPIYRDVGIIKAPLSDFVASLAIVLFQPFGVSDIFANRLMFWIIAAATVGMTYLAGRTIFTQRVIGVLAALMMMSYNFFAQRSVTGPEPKSLVILFSLAALVLIQKRRWGWAGICASLAALAWQPALIIVAIVLAAALYVPLTAPVTTPVKWYRHPRLVNLTSTSLGVAAPGVLFLAYLLANHATIAAWNATVGANLLHWQNNGARVPLLTLLARNWAMVQSMGAQFCFLQYEPPLVILGSLGFVGIVLAEVARVAVQRRKWRPDLGRTPFILYGLGFAAFTLVDFDFCPDLIPLMPVAAIGLGWLAWQVIALLSALWQRVSAVRNPTSSSAQPRRESLTPIQLGLSALAVVLIAGFGLADTWTYTITGATAGDQEQVVLEAERYLGPHDRTLELGDALIAIYTHRTNASKVLHLGSKSGLGVLAFEPGQVKGWIASLDRQPPKLITVSRENFPPWTADFYNWLDRKYRLVKVFEAGATIRMFVLK